MTTLSDIIAPSALLTVDNTKTVTNKTISGASNTINNLDASNLSSGTVATARLASGTADATTYLRGDQTWAAAVQYFDEAESTASPNNTVYVDSLSATGASTDVDVAVVPKGVGSFMLAVPDSTTTGGNKRGSYAVDLQLLRNSQTQVASGDYSFAANRANTASGAYSFCGGYINTASNSYAVAMGYNNDATTTGSTAIGYINDVLTNSYGTAIGYSNYVTGLGAVGLGYDNTVSNTGAVALGYQNTASGSVATALGYLNSVSGTRAFAVGEGNTTSNSYSAAIGYGNSVSSSYSVAIGNNNTVTSSYSAAIGSNNTADGIYSTVVGYYGDARQRYSVFNIGALTLSGARKSHTSLFTVGNTTTDATPTVLSASNSTSELYWNRMDTYCAYTLKILVVGMGTGGSYDAKSWEISALVKTTTGQPSIVGAITKNVVAADSGASSWDVDLVMSTTTAGFTIQVTGAAATTIRWTGSMYSAEALAA